MLTANRAPKASMKIKFKMMNWISRHFIFFKKPMKPRIPERIVTPPKTQIAITTDGFIFRTESIISNRSSMSFTDLPTIKQPMPIRTSTAVPKNKMILMKFVKPDIKEEIIEF